MAFYDANAEQKSLTPLQQALMLPPDVILHHQDLLSTIAKTANFSDEKAAHILDFLLKNLRESLSLNNPSNSLTSLTILDYCIRNGPIFGEYVFGRYILHQLYLLCSRDLTKVTSNHKEHQQFQYQLIGTILKWHQMYSNLPGSTLNYTFSRLQKSGILALYQSYKQTQSLFNPNAANSQNLPNLPPSPQQMDEKLQSAQDSNAQRDRAKTMSPISSSLKPIRPRSQSDSNMTANQRVHELSASKLVDRDGSVTLEYTEKFLLEISELMGRYLKPTRQILSQQKINLANPKLSKYLQILQVVQQRLVKVISEVKNEDSVVSISIKANDCIVDTILWFNSLVKKSKQMKDKKGNAKAQEVTAIKKNVMENVDLVGLEQQLLLDNAMLSKRKQERDQTNALKEQKQQQKEDKVKEQKKKKEEDKDKDKNNNNDKKKEDIPQQIQEDVVDLISGDIVDDNKDKAKEDIVIQEDVVDLISGDNKDKLNVVSSAQDNSFSSISLNVKSAQISENVDIVDLLNVDINDKKDDGVQQEQEQEQEQEQGVKDVVDDVNAEHDVNVEDVALEDVEPEQNAEDNDNANAIVDDDNQ